MQRLLGFLCGVCLASLSLAGAAGAAGGGGGGGGDIGGGRSGSGVEQKVAARRYDRAKQHFEEAKALEAKLETANASDRGDLEEEIHDHYDDARSDLEYVVRKQPGSYPAQSELGFALRKLGRFDDSLEAYDRALKLKPGYTPAIEYRGEASLELGKLGDARAAWEKLSGLDTELADQLLAKMQRWLARQKSAPSPGVTPAALSEFESWLAERKLSDMPPGFLHAAANGW